MGPYVHTSVSPSSRRVTSMPGMPTGRSVCTPSSNVHTTEIELAVHRRDIVHAVLGGAVGAHVVDDARRRDAARGRRTARCARRDRRSDPGRVVPLNHSTDDTRHIPRISGAPATNGSLQPARIGGGITSPYPPAGVCATAMSSTFMRQPYRRVRTPDVARTTPERDAASGSLPQPTAAGAVSLADGATVTGIALSWALPDSGSSTAASVRALVFIPAYRAATAMRVPSTP